MKILYLLFLFGFMVTLSQALDVDDLGCWKDTTTRDLKNVTGKNDKNLVIDACLNFCASKNTYYAGLEAGRQCFCGDTYGKYGKINLNQCNSPCTGDSSQSCGGQWALRIYNITRLVPCRYTSLKCGEGAVCANRDAKPVCECPVGKEGDPYEKCIDLPMSCGCWGDPHCHTFDKNNFDFMGRCIYDMISTECYGKTLPKGLTPFKVRVKQEKINSVPNADKVAFIRYVEILLKNTKYRLGTESKVQAVNEKSIRFYVNGIQRNPPFQDVQNGIQVYISGGFLIFSSKFGLTVTWGGKSKVEVLLSSSYSGLVCGLCGDGNNDPKNDFVDRLNKPVIISSNSSLRFIRFFDWGSNWRIDKSEYPQSDTSLDLNGTPCAADPCQFSPGGCPPLDPITCKNPLLYEDKNSWCGIMANLNGPWAKCAELMNPVQLAGAIEGCKFDMCALEGNETQNLFRCIAYETFTSQCYDVFNFNKVKYIINWRESANCPKTCGENEVFDVRAQCPRSCLFPQGNPDCGVLDPIEGCYCQQGYVLDANNKCIKESECGCKLPDGSTSIPVGEKLVSLDCREIYSCNGPLQNVTIEYMTKCSENGYCHVENNTPKCACNEGYEGNGYVCREIPAPPVNCTLNKCGVGANCNLVRGIETCSCPTGTIGDATDKCIPVPMSCGCWGDPHCHTFDKNNFDFMGRCIYDMISTECYGKTLPNGLTPFKVRVKQQKRDGVPNSDRVSFIRYIEIKVNNKIYRLETVSATELITKGAERVYVNNQLRKVPYQERSLGISIYMSGGYLRFTSNFGLSITWGGKSQAEILLSSSYSGFVCGLCGNGDGNAKNDFVDRNNNLVPLIGDRFNKYFNWGSSWRIPNDEYPASDVSIDINNNTCYDPVPPCNNPKGCVPSPACENVDLYETSEDWCAIMKNPSGPWAACITLMDKSLLEGIINGCVFDMCGLEGNNLQSEYRCLAYEIFTAQCYDIFNSFNIKSIIEWRNFTKCPKTCGENEVFDVRAQCPRSCLFPQGNPDCGVLDPIEGCYCQPGYILDSNNNCILESKCGCALKLGPERILLEIGENMYIDDCTHNYVCNVSESGVPVLNLIKTSPCSENAFCYLDENNQPNCQCPPGTQGDGYKCEPVTPPSFTAEPIIQFTKKPPVPFIPEIITPPPSLCDGFYQFCTIYGDPHYITTKGFKFNMNDNCTYLIATDECSEGQPRSYEIYSSHEFRNNRTDISYLKTVTVKVGSFKFEINDKIYLDGNELLLPFTSNDNAVVIDYQGSFIQMQTEGFLLKYFPGEFLKFYPCSASVKPFCGLCSLESEGPIYGYLDTNVQCSVKEFTAVL